VTGSDEAGGIADLVRRFAAAEGTPLWGTTPLAPLEPEGGRLREWLARGLHGGLGYLVATAGRRCDPTRGDVLRTGGRAAVVLGLPYERRAPGGAPAGGRVAGYARGRDYHAVFRGVLRRLAAGMRAAAPGLRCRPFCDAHAVMDKALAVRAGLGWQGRHTLVVHPEHGSTFVIGGLIVDRPLPASAPASPAGCGECRRCIAACPTGALRLPGVLDAGRCLARWTTAGLEPPAGLPRGPYSLGCDVCQDVCPFNAGPGPVPHRGFGPGAAPADQ
jgi:epoxyqueuosine reductase